MKNTHNTQYQYIRHNYTKSNFLKISLKFFKNQNLE